MKYLYMLNTFNDTTSKETMLRQFLIFQKLGA